MPLTTMRLDWALPDGIEDSLWGAYKFINKGIPRGKHLGLLIIVLPYVRDFDGKEFMVWAMCTSSIFLRLSRKSLVMFCRESGRGM